VDLRIVVRDDGSTDRSFEDLYVAVTEVMPDAIIERGPNLGPGQSFLSALECVNQTDDFVAFCDQDDVWLPDKLMSAVEALSELAPGPALYCCRLRWVDQDLAPIGLHPLPRRPLSFANALVQNVAPGPSIVIDRAALELLRAGSPSGAVMHDAWMYLVVSAKGKVYYDSEPHVLYRLHGRNVIGWNATIGRRVKRFAASGMGSYLGAQLRQASELQLWYGSSLPEDKQNVLARFIALGSGGTMFRLRYAWHPDVYRQQTLDDFLMRVAIGVSGGKGVDTRWQ
jgi:glycosyltransferase involved in cell wall biosynthesis